MMASINNEREAEIDLRREDESDRRRRTEVWVL